MNSPLQNPTLNEQAQKRKHMIVMIPFVVIPIFFCLLILLAFAYLSNKPVQTDVTPTITPTPTQEPISFVVPRLATSPMLNSLVTEQFNNAYVSINNITYLDFEKCDSITCNHYLLDKGRVSEFPILKTYAEFVTNPAIDAPNFNSQKFMISGNYMAQSSDDNNVYYELTTNLEVLVIAQFEGNVSVPGQYIFNVMATNPPPSIKYKIDELTASSLLILPTLSVGDMVAISGDAGVGSGAAGTSYIPLTTNIVIKAIN